MNEKFLGVGLVNAVAIGVLAMLLSIFLKTLFTLYEVEGLSEVIRSAQRRTYTRKKGVTNTMGRILTVNFWVNLFITTFFTMLMMWLIKKANTKINVPVVGGIIEEV